MSCPMILNFAQSMAVSLPCSVQNFKIIWQLKEQLNTNRILKDWTFQMIFEYLSYIVTTPSSPQPINSPAYIKGPPFTTSNATHLALPNRNQVNSDLYMHTRWPGNSPKKSLMAGVSESTAQLHVVRNNETERKCKQEFWRTHKTPWCFSVKSISSNLPNHTARKHLHIGSSKICFMIT